MTKEQRDRLLLEYTAETGVVVPVEIDGAINYSPELMNFFAWVEKGMGGIPLLDEYTPLMSERRK